MHERFDFLVAERAGLVEDGTFPWSEPGVDTVEESNAAVR